MEWLSANWTQIVALLWTLDQGLKIVAKMTPTPVDDNIADYVGGILSRFLPKK